MTAGNRVDAPYKSNIITITSISGILNSTSGGQFAYAASKAALIQNTKNMAKEFAEMGFRVNSIAPGIFPSEMTTGDSDERGKSSLGGGDSLPAKRPGNDRDMAQTVLYLACCEWVIS